MMQRENTTGEQRCSTQGRMIADASHELLSLFQVTAPGMFNGLE